MSQRERLLIVAAAVGVAFVSFGPAIPHLQGYIIAVENVVRELLGLSTL